MKLTIYYSRSLGSWVAQCEQSYTRPWTYKARSWEDARHMALHHLRQHEDKRKISATMHSAGDMLTSTNGRIP